MRTSKLAWAASALLVVASGAYAIQRTKLSFDFKDPKGVNSVSFLLDSMFEPIAGMATGIEGNVQFDPADPAATRGTVTVDVASMKVANPKMSEHMMGKDWMDAANHPKITFAIVGVQNLRNTGTAEKPVYSATVVGDFTMKGVTRRVTAPVTVSYFKDGLGNRVGNLMGDLMVVRTKFSINRKDFGVDGKTPEEIVSNKVDISFSIAAGSPR